MSTFQTRIEDRIGTVGDPTSDTTFISNSLKDAYSELMTVMPPPLLWSVSLESSAFTTNGYGIDTVKIVDVLRENGVAGNFVTCKFIDEALEYRLKDPQSIYYPDKHNPMYTLREGNIYIYPEPSSSGDSAKVRYIPNATILHTDTEVSGTVNTGCTTSGSAGANYSFSKSNHGFAVGQNVDLSGFTQLTDLNGVRTQVKAVADANTFTLEGVISTGTQETTGGTVKLVGQFPKDMEYLLILKTCIICLERQITDLINEGDIELSQIKQAQLNQLKGEFTNLMTAGNDSQ